ncbi:MAG: ACT domain-containing protein, partial [Bacteroidales bacterium]|nr:ACT domain-containing protein [Bacteroidales bacterium]
ADPALVPEARSIGLLSYHEAMELSHFGAKILFPLSLYPAMIKKIPVIVRNTFNPAHPGTLIGMESAKGNGVIRGITSLRNISLINVEGSGMAGVTGISARMFGSLSQNNINIILISQASSEQSICVAVRREDSSDAIRILREAFVHELSAGLITSVYGEEELAIVAVVGENMRHVPGVAAKVFTPLGRNGINIKAISQGSSELNISFVINEGDLKKTLRVLHQALFSSEIRRLNIFMAGTGSIGSRLLEMIHEQEKSLLSQRIELKICGLINTRKMILSDNGISPGNWKAELETSADAADFRKFSGKIVTGKYENSVFIDATASDQPVEHYSELISSNVSIVAANKRANTGSLGLYLNLQNSARRSNVLFNYETNVGAGLPVINVIRNLISGGDEIIKIEAVLSGTVNWLLSEYDGSRPFCELVKEAMRRGYTEPYPGDDLLGIDVARKILLLARESGFMLEPEDVETEPVLPGGVPEGIDTDHLLDIIRLREGLIRQTYKEADERNMKLKYVAVTGKGYASVKLTATDTSHPFYTLKGSENCLIFTTKYYSQYPLVIKGPGAGVDVTSAGLLADIVRIAESVRV